MVNHETGLYIHTHAHYMLHIYLTVPVQLQRMQWQPVSLACMHLISTQWTLYNTVVPELQINMKLCM